MSRSNSIGGTGALPWVHRGARPIDVVISIYRQLNYTGAGTMVQYRQDLVISICTVELHRWLAVGSMPSELTKRPYLPLTMDTLIIIIGIMLN